MSRKLIRNFSVKTNLKFIFTNFLGAKDLKKNAMELKKLELRLAPDVELKSKV